MAIDKLKLSGICDNSANIRKRVEVLHYEGDDKVISGSCAVILNKLKKIEDRAKKLYDTQVIPEKE